MITDLLPYKLKYLGVRSMILRSSIEMLARVWCHFEFRNIASIKSRMGLGSKLPTDTAHYSSSYLKTWVILELQNNKANKSCRPSPQKQDFEQGYK